MVQSLVRRQSSLLWAYLGLISSHWEPSLISSLAAGNMAYSKMPTLSHFRKGAWLNKAIKIISEIAQLVQIMKYKRFPPRS